MSSTLDTILHSVRARVNAAKSSGSQKQLEKAAGEHQPRGFRRALAARATHAPAIIAEIKKASPSKGLLRADLPVAALAHELERAGATCLSVLTEPDFFQGSLPNLELASISTRLPCLRKDFILDEFQILEARAHHADAILLIVAALTDPQLRDLQACAQACELDVLCEVHDASELDRVLEIGGFNMIGVNSRNLRDLSVSLETASTLVPGIPSGCVRIAESGITSAADIARLRNAGFHAFLIGERLMRAERPGDALRAMLCSSAQTGHAIA